MLEISFLATELAFSAIWLFARLSKWKRQQRIDWKQEAVLLLMYVNLAVIIRFVFFPRDLVDGHVQPLVFEATAIFPLRINLVPLVHLFDYDSFRDVIWNVVGNAVIFIPSGILLPIVYRQLSSFWKVVAAGALISLCTEILQLPFPSRASDIDDLILNMLGVVAGYGIYAAFKNLSDNSRFAGIKTNKNLMRDTTLKKYTAPIIMLAVFETIAVTLWVTKDNIFYFFNFSYIGCSIALGILLFIRKHKYARRIVQLLVGLYMLIYLGLICGENMQIEGFWYYLFTGVFEAATIHYAVAKIFGPLIFGRGWCGYACWTAMVLDFLPYKVPVQHRKKLGWIRYVTFVVSLIFVASLFLAHVGNLERIMFWAFIVGNVVYYAVGIILACVYKDNRAFCKYICPVTVFLKPMSYYALVRVTCDKEKCVSCGKCKSICPMNVDVTDNSRKRENGTECILCMECVRNCPKSAL